MKAVSFDGTGAAFVPDHPDPEPGESLVRVSLAGICGTDLEMLQGYMKYRGIMGHEFVGVVAESQDDKMVGKRVVGEINAGCGRCDLCRNGMERHCPDRTVLGILGRNGAFAEFLSLPQKNLHVLPDCITDEQAVFVEPLAAAFEIREQVRLQKGWRVAIVGDGRLAQLISQVLRTYCPDTVCFGRHRTKLELLDNLGIATGLGIKEADCQSFDLVVEATGSGSGLGDAVRLARPRGTIVLKSTIASKEGADLTPAIVNEITLVGSRCGLFRPAIDALATGTVSVDYMIDSTFALEEFADAVRHARKPGTLKVFLKP